MSSNLYSLSGFILNQTFPFLKTNLFGSASEYFIKNLVFSVSAIYLVKNKEECARN